MTLERLPFRIHDHPCTRLLAMFSACDPLVTLTFTGAHAHERVEKRWEYAEGHREAEALAARVAAISAAARNVSMISGVASDRSKAGIF